jgi:hypothetical protein
MKTLVQIEPRAPISSTPFIITQPGSYYLTTNIIVTGVDDDAIDIDTNNVTLDLNGFTISSTVGYVGIGVNNDALGDITICNGHIAGGVTYSNGVYSGNGFAYGVIYFGDVEPSPANFRITGVSVSGCLYQGIDAGIYNSSVVESCTVRMVGGVGISAATVSHSAAYECGDDAIDAVNASDCSGLSTASYDGINTTTAINCSGTSSSGYGIFATTANNCTGVSTSGTGLSASIATACYGTSTTGKGLSAANIATGCYGTSSSGTGLQASIANTCWGSSSGGIGLNSTIANTCYSSSGDGSIVNKYNMP